MALDYRYMTEESDHSDCVIQHSLPWRSGGNNSSYMYIITLAHVGGGYSTLLLTSHLKILPPGVHNQRRSTQPRCTTVSSKC